MEIRLDRLGAEPFTWNETIDFPPDALNRAELVSIDPVRCHGTIRQVDSGFLLQATLRYEQTLSCVRCLAPSALPVQAAVELLLILEVDGGEAGTTERELESEDLGIVRLSEPKVDTEPILNEQIQLNIPMKHLCKEDCAGLCGSCGADLNQGPCTCQAAVDPRWSALQGLRDESSN